MRLASALLLITAVALGGCTFKWAQTLSVFRSLPPDRPQGDPQRGETIFREGANGAPPCITCHALAQGNFSLGPVMVGIGQRAASRMTGQRAEVYLRQSILDPLAFITPGFRPIMYPDYAQHLTETDIADLIAFLMTL